MNEDRAARIKRLFQEAIDLGPAERERFLADCCGDDPDLRREVELLCVVDRADDRFLEGGPRDSRLASGLEGESFHGRTIGGYRLLRQIAAGGMGAVFEAEQENPRRLVALKVLRAGLLSPDALQRFTYETQVLASLRHPGIAQIFEAGAESIGGVRVPFFTMELVPNARSITDYSRGMRLGTRARLELFAEACEAVQYGHQRGVIHRDLKPSNILVGRESSTVPLLSEQCESEGRPASALTADTAVAQVKIIDFGVARSTTGDERAAARATSTGQLIGTLPYMSPEQCGAGPQDIDVRCDVYSLGVVLYELLCDRLPYHVDCSDVLGAARIIREQAPTRPSTIHRVLRGDLETIVLKALEKDRGRRYQSVEALARDLRHHLASEPIEARRDSTWYVLRKLVRRNRAMVAAAAVVVFALAGGVAMLSVGLSRARSESRRASEALEQTLIANRNAQEINRFLIDLLSKANPSQGSGAEVTIREALDSAAGQVETSFFDQPRVEMALQATIGGAYESLGLKQEARQHCRRSVELAERIGESWSDEGVRARATFLRTVQSVDEAVALVPQAEWFLAECRRRLGTDHPMTGEVMGVLSAVYCSAHEYPRARAMHRELMEHEAANRLRNPERYYRLAMDHALSLAESGQRREAVGLLEGLAPEMKQALGPGSRTYIQALASLGSAYHDFNELEKAESYYRQALDASTRRSGPNHVDSIYFEHWLAVTLYRLKRNEEAERIERDAYGRANRVLGGENPMTIQVASYIGIILDAVGKHAESELVYTDVLRSRRRSLPEGDPLILQAECNLAGNLIIQRRRAEALPLLVDACKWVDRLPPRDERRARIPGDVGLTLCDLSRAGEAEPYLRESVRLRREWNMPLTKTARRIYAALADICQQNGHAEEAAAFRAAATASAPAAASPTATSRI